MSKRKELRRHRKELAARVRAAEERNTIRGELTLLDQAAEYDRLYGPGASDDVSILRIVNQNMYNRAYEGSAELFKLVETKYGHVIATLGGSLQTHALAALYVTADYQKKQSVGFQSQCFAERRAFANAYVQEVIGTKKIPAKPEHLPVIEECSRLRSLMDWGWFQPVNLKRIRDSMSRQGQILDFEQEFLRPVAIETFAHRKLFNIDFLEGLSDPRKDNLLSVFGPMIDDNRLYLVGGWQFRHKDPPDDDVNWQMMLSAIVWFVEPNRVAVPMMPAFSAIRELPGFMSCIGGMTELPEVHPIAIMPAKLRDGEYCVLGERTSHNKFRLLGSYAITCDSPEDEIDDFAMQLVRLSDIYANRCSVPLGVADPSIDRHSCRKKKNI